MEQRITENMGRSLKEHGYRDPVFVGKGSFAKVYRVRDEKRDFQACKISKVTEQWEQECRNSREICHPLFPAYREHWTDGEWGYLVMEFWDGCDLRKMLDRRGRLSPGQAARIALQITEGLQYLHERPHPFLYRDLKPENIRIRVDGRAGILDLGCLWSRTGRERETEASALRSSSCRGRFPGKRVMSMQWADCWQLCWEMTQTAQSDNLGE